MNGGLTDVRTILATKGQSRVIQAKSDSVAKLRNGWERQWLRDHAGSPAERSAMLGIHAVLHAVSHLLASSDEPAHGLGAILDDAERRLGLVGSPAGDSTPAVASTASQVPRADLAELLRAQEELGRMATPGLAGEMTLAARVVRRLLPPSEPVGLVAPIQAIAAGRPLKVERSRPDWHLNGTVRGVPWSPAVERLAVFGIDEGDNDVLALVAPRSPGVEITVVESSGSGRVLADISFDDVTLPTVVHCPGEPALLGDILTVLAMADVIGAVSWLLDRPDAHAELQLCRASLRAAAASLTSPSVVRRQHDVSAAALLVLPTCLRLAGGVPGQDDPEAARRVQRVREQVLALPAWHRDRLVALV